MGEPSMMKSLMKVLPVLLALQMFLMLVDYFVRS